MTDKPEEKPAEPTDKDQDQEHLTSIFLVPYPKIVFLYPTFIMSAIATVWLMVGNYDSVSKEDAAPVVLTSIFLIIAGINLVVLAFDFPRATSLTLFFFVAAIGLGLTLLFTLKPNLLPTVTDFIKSIRPVANSTFFLCVTIGLAVLYGIVMVTVKFNYWEVRPNELLHHHGVLSDLKRYSAPNLRIDKEINDVFEYMLLRSGRLILQPSSERRAIILDNVPFIGRKEEAITKMLGALQVQVRGDGSTT